jgi:type II secretory pathway component GspD/PulD (secretin)
VFEGQRRPADELTKALLQRYEGNPGVSAFVAPESNVLLVSALPNLVDEVVQALADLDQPLRTAQLEVLVVEFASRKGDEADSKAPDSASEMKELSGPAEQVEARIKALTQAGTIAAVKRMRLQVRENETSQFHASAEAPRISGATLRRGSTKQFLTFEQYPLETNVTVIPRFTRDGKAALELSIRDQRLHPPSDAPDVGKNENGPFIISAVGASKFDSRTIVGAGQAVLLEGLEYESVLPGYRLGVIVKVDGKPSPPAGKE